jgi:HEAT repeat protein
MKTRMDATNDHMKKGSGIMSKKIYAAILAAGLAMPGIASAGIDGTTGKIQSAVQANSVDAIVAELERAENIPERGAFDTVFGLIDHDSERVREAAGWWLGRRGVRIKVIAIAKARLTAQDPTAARNVLDTLRGMRDIQTLGMIGTYVANPLDEQSGIAGLRALGAIGAPEGLTMLNPALGNAMIGVRAQALRTVRELRAPVGQKVVTVGTAYLPMLNDADPTVRREAAITLGFLGQSGLNTDPVSSGVNALVSTVANDSSATVRKAAAWALGEIGNAAGRDALRKATNDTDANVRSVATAAAGRLH